jgi:amino acid permease
MFSVYNELGNRTIGRLNAVIGQSVAIALGVYQTVGILGYLSFGSKVLPNLILMYESGTVVLVGRVLLVLLQVFSYPLQCHPCRTCLDQILPRQLPEYKRQRRSSDASLSTTSSADPMDDVSPQPTSHDVRFFWLTTGILLGSYLLAISVSQLDVVLAFVGATGSTAISFVLPGLFYWSMHRTAPMDLTKLASGVLMVVGMVVMVVCLTANVIKVTRAGEP